MKNRILKLGVSMILLITMLFPNTIAIAAESEETTWATMASMLSPRTEFQTEVINGKIYAIGGLNGSTRLSSVEVYDSSTNNWTLLASMSTPRNYLQTEVINGKIYAIGGVGSTSNLSSAEVYDPSTNTWTTLAPMSTIRYKFQTEVIDGKIYAIGGQNISSAEVYDPASDSWTSIASMEQSRYNFQTEVIDGKIYAIGGEGKIATSPTTVEVYDPSSDSWTTLAPMSSRRHDFQTEVIDGKIYAIGGIDGTSVSTSLAEVYDPSSDTWTSLASMSTPRAFYQTEEINGIIYAIGGINGNKSSGTRLTSTEVYNPSNDTWTPLASMSTPRGSYQAEVLDGKIYVIGGSYIYGTDLYSMEAYGAASSSSTNKLKVVLEINENLQLSVDDNLSENTGVTWVSSNSAVASVDENGMVTALASGNATITVSDGASYSEFINVLVVENADTYRLAIDLQVGDTSRLTVDDYTNTATVTWATSDPSVATITNAGRVTAANPGLTLVTATDEEDNQIGQAYVRVRA